MEKGNMKDTGGTPPKVEMVGVVSSNVAKVGHSPSRGLLFVEFKGGRMYEYAFADGHGAGGAFKSITGAASPGKALRGEVAGIPYREVGSLEKVKVLEEPVPIQCQECWTTPSPDPLEALLGLYQGEGEAVDREAASLLGNPCKGMAAYTVAVRHREGDQIALHPLLVGELEEAGRLYALAGHTVGMRSADGHEAHVPVLEPRRLRAGEATPLGTLLPLCHDPFCHEGREEITFFGELTAEPVYHVVVSGMFTGPEAENCIHGPEEGHLGVFAVLPREAGRMDAMFTVGAILDGYGGDHLAMPLLLPREACAADPLNPLEALLALWQAGDDAAMRRWHGPGHATLLGRILEFEDAYTVVEGGVPRPLLRTELRRAWERYSVAGAELVEGLRAPVLEARAPVLEAGAHGPSDMRHLYVPRSPGNVHVTVCTVPGGGGLFHTRVQVGGGAPFNHGMAAMEEVARTRTAAVSMADAIRWAAGEGRPVPPLPAKAFSVGLGGTQAVATATACPNTQGHPCISWVVTDSMDGRALGSFLEKYVEKGTRDTVFDGLGAAEAQQAAETYTGKGKEGGGDA